MTVNNWGLAKIDDIPVMIIGHEKGKGTDEKVKRNFGMPQPEGYRKAKRLMKMAEQFDTYHNFCRYIWSLSRNRGRGKRSK